MARERNGRVHPSSKLYKVPIADLIATGWMILTACVLDGSGWCWAIPLHNESLSVGVVMRQDLFFGKKKLAGYPSSVDHYKECLKLAPQILKLLEKAETVSDIKQASDWSYSASAYAGPHFRLAGDAGCFIDPYFSSGVHLALASGLSAAMTIQAARKGDCTEFSAAKWHSNKVTEGYTRFLLIVMTVLRQLRQQERSLLGSDDEQGFDTAFGFIQPGMLITHSCRIVCKADIPLVIQGTADADVSNKHTKNKEVAAIDFALSAFKGATPEQQRAVLEKVQHAGHEPEELEKLTQDELAVLNNIVNRQLELTKSEKNLDNFANDVIDGWIPVLRTGSLGLKRFGETNGSNGMADLFDLDGSI